MRKTLGIHRNKYEILQTCKINFEHKKNMYLCDYRDSSTSEKITICPKVTIPSIRPELAKQQSVHIHQHQRLQPQHRKYRQRTQL
jgi:hypothetical protein